MPDAAALLHAFGGRMLIGVVVEEFGKSVHGVPVVPVRHGLRRDLAALDEIEVRAAVFDHVGIVVDIVIGEYERIDVAAVASGMLAFERGIERGARFTPHRADKGPRDLADVKAALGDLARDELGVVALHLLEPRDEEVVRERVVGHVAGALVGRADQGDGAGEGGERLVGRVFPHRLGCLDEQGPLRDGEAVPVVEQPAERAVAIVVLRRDEEVAGHVVGERATVNDGDVDLIG